MTTTSSEIDFSQYVGQNIQFVHNLSEPNEKGESAVEIEGNVQLVNAGHMLVKPRGQVKFTMIALSEVENVSIVENTAKKFKANKLKPVKLGDVRRHLLDRHGVQITWANSCTEEQALAYHDSLDHAALDLGHVHQSKDEADAEKSATPAAADEPQGVPDQY